jgi:hypothetical protein
MFAAKAPALNVSSTQVVQNLFITISSQMS